MIYEGVRMYVCIGRVERVGRCSGWVEVLGVGCWGKEKRRDEREPWVYCWDRLHQE
jgi:hypothetical protein